MGGAEADSGARLIFGVPVSTVELYCAAKAWDEVEGAFRALDVIEHVRRQGTLLAADALVLCPPEIWDRVRGELLTVAAAMQQQVELDLVKGALCDNCSAPYKDDGDEPEWPRWLAAFGRQYWEGNPLEKFLAHYGLHADWHDHDDLYEWLAMTEEESDSQARCQDVGSFYQWRPDLTTVLRGCEPILGGNNYTHCSLGDEGTKQMISRGFSLEDLHVASQTTSLIERFFRDWNVAVRSFPDKVPGTWGPPVAWEGRPVPAFHLVHDMELVACG
ncbi:uncharacterized protein JCM10292_001864 [Rhodotorula paludigena]|uniref:uncharacterized protein n=1 Tax=Rhodotorula paludigena TaxID=86838 RepID=UPI0031730AD2